MVQNSRRHAATARSALTDNGKGPSRSWNGRHGGEQGVEADDRCQGHLFSEYRAEWLSRDVSGRRRRIIIPPLSTEDVGGAGERQASASMVVYHWYLLRKWRPTTPTKCISTASRTARMHLRGASIERVSINHTEYTVRSTSYPPPPCHPAPIISLYDHTCTSTCSSTCTHASVHCL